MNESFKATGTVGKTAHAPLQTTHRISEKYRALTEATGQAVWSWSPDGTVNDFERSREWWQELTGQSIEQQKASDDAWLEVVHPDDRAAAAAAWSTAITTSSKYDVEYRVRGRLGGWLYVRARGVPVQSVDGVTHEWVGTLEDVTLQHHAQIERERLLAEVDAERRKLEEVFQHAPSFIAVLRGPDHVFERVNEHYTKLIGGREVVGKPVREALPEIAGQGYFELLDQVFQSGQPKVVVDARVRLQNPGAPTERVLQFVYQPMLDLKGSVSGVIVQGIDLTEQRLAEAELARVTAASEWQRQMYETALSNTADFIYLFDTRGRFTYVNRALLDLWGKKLSEAVGRNFFELDYPAALAERLQRQIQEVIDTGRQLRDETPYTSAQGTAAYEYIFMPVFGASGAVEAVAGSTREITDRKRAEEGLRQSERRYRALVNATSDVVYRMSADWVHMQPLDGRGFLASTAEPTQDWMPQNVPEFEQARAWAAINQAIDAKTTFELEHQVNRADGTLGWTFSRAVPILDDAGNIVEWFGTASDITRQRHAEEELRDIRSRMEAALDAGAIGTWSWDVQADRFYGDTSLAKMFSVAQTDVAGGNLSRVMRSIHPDDRREVIELIQQALATSERYEADYRIAQPDGSWKWVTARGKIERDAAGQAVRFPGVVIDVTDWKRAKEQLVKVTEESERRRRVYETILSNTPDLAYVFDLNYRIAYANEILLRMWGRTSKQSIGATLLELGYEPWHAEMHNREIDQVRATRASIRGEVPFNGTFGRRVYDYIFVPIFGANGEVEAVAGTTRDVTERKEAEEALRDADRKKDDFLALLAHELRNPLAPIRNGLQVLRLAEHDPQTVAEARDMMDRQLSHMVRLIDDLLDISRITRNKMELRRARVSLAEIVGVAVEAAGSAIQSSGLQLTVKLPPQAISLDADLTRLAQVFSNLLTNSAKYTPAGGKIWLTAERVANEVVVSVRDTGIGIPVNALPTIFDMFSQVDRSMERSKGGLGIGLALVKGLVEMHGGSVAAESVEGSGSTFTVRLPICSQAHAENSTNGGAEPIRDIRRRILVVDDNHDGARSMAKMLQLLGNEVATAHDGQEAVETADAFRPDVILMDLGLPRLNGLEATRQIRERKWGREVTIIALTGWGQENDREQSRQAGCDGHLVKPVSLSDLEKVLTDIVGH
ncbi:PAS domain-containing hybrid sensor histidine kinase/response regulator [Anatilimnocola floriformis]|uniref:PAS domain-containing hybrid sensor histidine kinase/response regulator n=1 Tax=Anatilimnocola floriformis TaxID=2948575 RepID=UPI0020C553C4|nr:PAS domain-containing protein [Anatilimnocola floriformis]